VNGRTGGGSLACIGISSNGAPSITIGSQTSIVAQQELDQSNDNENGHNAPANPRECFDSLENSAYFVMTPAIFEIRELSL
jgi:hypothetical protein